MRVIAHQGDTVDALCYRHYGRTAGMVEAVLLANRGLAALGAVLPHGTSVELPDLPPPPTAPLIQLWD
ncbi:tail protein X [Chitinimonas sp. BJB300]|uniref:tail protein X n=1 Tax=Chitinimonas sp. BJB300 TaxID=1559339 RepID=UPI000C0D1CB4|nr:tail protein X [Chitinimonas sp. BJB300]PHV11323.1 phage tail protein [Chitinimonas sp. BJB300]TSJ88217.1 phage tail protein [Chitinimonas sp. BJB300]